MLFIYQNNYTTWKLAIKLVSVVVCGTAFFVVFTFPKNRNQTSFWFSAQPPLFTCKKNCITMLKDVHINAFQFNYPAPGRGTGYCFRAISFFLSLFIYFFVSNITRNRLD